MSKKTTLILFYSGIALLAVCIVVLASFLHRQNESSGRMPTGVVNTGKESVDSWFEIQKDLVATNQLGEEVRLSDLKGKVWLAAEFFAVCPHCAVRNGEELHKIFSEFRDQPDFRIVCISIDPDNDDVDRLAAYSKALNADPATWWFLNAGDTKATHRYLEEELKFFGVRERKDPVDIKANGRFAHDLGFLLVDRNFRVIGKWPLADARSEEARQRDPELYDRLKADLYAKVREALAADPDPEP